MQNWEEIWEKLITDKDIKEEYQKAFLLNMFKKICIRMKNDEEYRNKLTTLFRQSSDHINTSKIIIQKAFDYEMKTEEAELMWKWFNANRHKSSSRKAIPISTKKELYNQQNGICPLCNQPLGQDWGKIHVDHIIPWSLVGDELVDNYQDLCETCNECKNAKIDYVFRNLINMN